MPRINSVIKPFETDAFHNGQFTKVTDKDLKGKWSVIFFYPADFTFVCPTELEDLAENYATFQNSALRFIQFRRINTLPINPGMKRHRRSAKLNSRCWRTRRARSHAILT